MKALLIIVVLAAAAGRAEAYPQFQLSRDQTCTGCHLAPSGAGLLNENGLTTSETMSQFGTAPEFFYGKVPTPDWLVLGGDLRGGSGYIHAPENLLASFPMQVDLYVHAKLPAGLSLHITGGPRDTELGNEAATHVWSREHYLMWQQNPGETTGLYVRAGRFMPVFGLRLAEHPTYIRRYGGTPLWADTYGAAVEYIQDQYEVHVTGFIKDPVIDTPEHSNGGAALAEYRLTKEMSVGGEFMYTKSTDEHKFRAGVLGKLYMPGPDLLLSAEAQFVNQVLDRSVTAGMAPRGAPKQVVAYLLGSKFLSTQYLLDVGLGYYNENIEIYRLHRECVDLNFHWFATSHVEALLTARFEMLAFGNGGPNNGYALAQLHYRL